MNYDEAIAFWYGRINYEVRAAKPADLKLERMQALLSLLGNPHDRLRLVHVTGTKGKGSTSAMLASILRAAGYRVGLFTSPHLTQVEERIQVDGTSISAAELTALMEEVAPAVRVMESADGIAPTFFEIGTALGFLHFVRRGCDIAVIEVGLGGRFDSTNVCRPLVSVITSVGFDHTAQLGTTLEEIAFQKAGIVKPGVPVISGVTEPGPRAVIREVASDMDAPLWELRRDFDYEYRFDRGGSRVAVRTPSSNSPPHPLRLLGEHQGHNAALAAATVERLREQGLAIPDGAVAVGLAGVSWPARIEVVAIQPTVILDCAHNVPSAEALVKTLRQAFPDAPRKAIVFAVSSDKSYADMIRILAGYFDHFHLTKYGNNPRCVDPGELGRVLNDAAPGKPSSSYPDSGDAWVAARSKAEPNDLICITGSVFLAGELRPLLLSHSCERTA
jgi:dihydrofolate synthase/folylpolyglutamate synthase